MKETYLSIIRHALTALGVFLVSRGIINEGSLQEITGTVIALVGGLWGAYDEYAAAKKLKQQSPAVQEALK